MKKYILKLFVFIFSILVFQSCNSNEIIEQVDAAITSGAVLRTKEIVNTNKTFDFNNPSSKWIVKLEEQDEKNGDLFASINVYAKLKKYDPILKIFYDPKDSKEALIKNIPASAFTDGPNGLPVGSVDVIFSEVLSSLNLNSGDYVMKDKFNIRLELVLTDGRKFSVSNSNGTIAGSYFNSPFQYSVEFSN